MDESLKIAVLAAISAAGGALLSAAVLVAVQLLRESRHHTDLMRDAYLELFSGTRELWEKDLLLKIIFPSNDPPRELITKHMTLLIELQLDAQRVWLIDPRDDRANKVALLRVRSLFMEQHLEQYLHMIDAHNRPDLAGKWAVKYNEEWSTVFALLHEIEKLAREDLATTSWSRLKNYIDKA